MTRGKLLEGLLYEAHKEEDDCKPFETFYKEPWLAANLDCHSLGLSRLKEFKTFFFNRGEWGDGEEDIPDWYFEDGVVFLPEELVAGLCLPYRELRRRFEEEHPMLLTVAYWEAIQRDLQAGKVPVVAVYPESERIVDD